MSWDKAREAVIEDGDLLLRAVEERDREQFRAIAFDPEIWRYFLVRVENEADLDRYIADAVNDTRAGRRVVFAVIDKAAGRILGSMAYANMSEKDARLEIGWSWLARAARGTGRNARAKLLMLRYAFEDLGCERVEFKTDALNQGARKGLLNIGATEEGTLRSFNPMPGNRRRDAVYYSILKGEWPGVEAMLRAKPFGPLDGAA